MLAVQHNNYIPGEKRITGTITCCADQLRSVLIYRCSSTERPVSMCLCKTGCRKFVFFSILFKKCQTGHDAVLTSPFFGLTSLCCCEAVSPEKEDYYADILIYVTGCVLFILAVVIVILCRMRMTTQKTLPTPPVQKLSKFPLKRQVTESRYKIRTNTFPLDFHPTFWSLLAQIVSDWYM